MLLLIVKLFWAYYLVSWSMTLVPGEVRPAVSPQKFWGTPTKLICLTIIRSAFQVLPLSAHVSSGLTPLPGGPPGLRGWTLLLAPIINALVHRSRITIVTGLWAEVRIMLMVLTLCCILSMVWEAKQPYPFPSLKMLVKRDFSSKQI